MPRLFLDLPNAEAVNEAIEIVNEIGLQYLRGAFNPDLVAQAIAPLDADKATDPETGMWMSKEDQFFPTAMQVDKAGNPQAAARIMADLRARDVLRLSLGQASGRPSLVAEASRRAQVRA